MSRRFLFCFILYREKLFFNDIKSNTDFNKESRLNDKIETKGCSGFIMKKYTYIHGNNKNYVVRKMPTFVMIRICKPLLGLWEWICTAIVRILCWGSGSMYPTQHCDQVPEEETSLRDSNEDLGMVGGTSCFGQL